LKEHNFI